MIYTPSTKIAIQLAFDANWGQYDKGGLPYLTHPLHVAEPMYTDDECVIALLHDVLEDTEMMVSDLQQWGITERQIEAKTGTAWKNTNKQCNCFKRISSYN